MSGTRDPFQVQVERWVAKAQADANAAMMATATDALARVKELTPVVTGNLRANWTIMLQGAADTIDGNVNSQDVIAKFEVGDQIIIGNPVVYAPRVNWGFTGTDSLGRHYNQNGKYMIEQTVAEMPAIAANATARIVAGQG